MNTFNITLSSNEINQVAGGVGFCPEFGSPQYRSIICYYPQDPKNATITSTTASAYSSSCPVLTTGMLMINNTIPTFANATGATTVTETRTLSDGKEICLKIDMYYAPLAP